MSEILLVVHPANLPSLTREQTDVISLETDLFVKEAGTGRLFLFLTEGSWGQMKSAGSVSCPLLATISGL